MVHKKKTRTTASREGKKKTRSPRKKNYFSLGEKKKTSLYYDVGSSVGRLFLEGGGEQMHNSYLWRESSTPARPAKKKAKT